MIQMNTIHTILSRIQDAITPVSGNSGLHEAETILQHVLQCTRSDLYINPAFISILENKKNEIDAIVTRRCTDEPLAYILGTKYFFSKEIFVDGNVLIPRPESEVLVDIVLKNETDGICKFADIGTGSGAIAAVLLSERSSWTAVATDLSLAALRVAQSNTPQRIRFICCDMFTAFGTSADGFDFIVCNPPYISASEMQVLDKSVIDFEPHSALYGGPDGLNFYRVLSTESKKVLKPGGRLYCEIGFDQGDSVRKLFLSENWSAITVRNDIAGRPRVVSARSQG
jgi:release factor glutamine methyltransferase